MTIGHDSQTAGIQSAAPNRKQKFLVVNNGIAESKKKKKSWIDHSESYRSPPIHETYGSNHMFRPMDLDMNGRFFLVWHLYQSLKYTTFWCLLQDKASLFIRSLYCSIRTSLLGFSDWMETVVKTANNGTNPCYAHQPFARSEIGELKSM